MTLRQAFFHNVASPILFKLWKKAQAIEPLQQAPVLWSLALVGLMAVIYGIGRFSDPSADVFIVLGAGTAVIFSCGVLGAGSSMRRFIRDCKDLDQRINTAGLVGEGELRKLSFEHLVGMAMPAVISSEKEDYEANARDKAVFSTEFEFFKRFGLTEEKWGPYFKEAMDRYYRVQSEAGASAPSLVHN